MVAVRKHPSGPVQASSHNRRSTYDERKLDLNQTGFKGYFIGLEVTDAEKLLLKDDLKCSNEDQVVDHVLEYEKLNGECLELIESIRFDFVTTEKLMELGLG